MDARFRVGGRALVALALMLLLTAGCTSHGSSANPTPTASTNRAKASSRPTIAPIEATASPLVAAGGSRATAGSSSGATVVVTGAPCAAAVGRATTAAAKLLPEGTRRSARPVSTCLGDLLLDTTFASTTALTWTVRIMVAAGTASKCQLGAANAGAHCVALAGHPGVIGAEATCSAISCDQAWVYANGYLVIVLGSVPGGKPGVSQLAIPSFSGLGTIIGAEVVEEISS